MKTLPPKKRGSRGMKAPPTMWQATAKKFGISEVGMESFLRWAHGEQWWMKRPSDLIKVAEEHGVATTLPMADSLMQLYRVFREEEERGKKQETTDTG